MAAPNPSKPMPSAAGTIRGPREFGFEADFADLAARFAAKSGGGLSPELSAELALEIVLNEIVEQACQITGASGATIILEQDGEITCRASSGSTAPQLGSRLDAAGLVGECLRSRKTLWCDDTFTDPRAGSDLSRQSGVRSIVMMPLLRDDVLIGLFELLSTQPYAFGVRDERTLEMLADRTLTNLDRAVQPFEAQPELDGPAADLQEENLQKIGLPVVNLQSLALESLAPAIAAARPSDSAQSRLPNSGLLDPNAPKLDPLKKGISDPTQAVPKGSSSADPESDFVFPDFDPAEMTPEEIQALLKDSGVIASDPPPGLQELARQGKRRLLPAPPEPAAPKQIDYISWALGFAIVSAAVLLGLVLGQHFILSRLHAPVRAAAVAPAEKLRDAIQTSSPAAAKPDISKPESSGKPSRPAHATISHEPPAKSDGTVPPGGLLVSENGKEVFRLPPASDSGNAPAHQVVQSASQIAPNSSPQRVVQVPEAAAQREVVYRAEPEYPEAARQQNIQGAVVLELHIGTNGSVQDVEVVSGPPILAQASTDAVKQWKFKPRVVDGSPVEMQTRVTFNFKLPQ